MTENFPSTIAPRVIGERLLDARRQRGLTQDRAAREVGLSRTTVVAIEKGERRVSADELVAFCALYNCPITSIVRSHPRLEAFVPQFRSAYRTDIDGLASLELAARTLQKLTENYVALEELTGAPLTINYPPPVELSGLKVSPEQFATDLAAQERNRLGLGDGPVLDLRTRLEVDVGLRIFSFPMEMRIAGLFGYNDRFGGCVGLNALHPYQRRRWSLAHECGHFLTTRYKPDASFLKASGSRVLAEKVADQFATEFLMPASGVNRRFSEILQANGSVSMADVCVLADLFQVSVQAFVIRLEELRRIKIGTWDRLADIGFRPLKAKEMLGLSTTELPEERYPKRFIGLAVRAFEQGLLSEGELSEMLQMEPVEARHLIQNFKNRRLVTELEDDFSSVKVDLSSALE
jgi:Zn-dependent peptidase ImmA (M78 family)/DNA-binding XRE family transcriptional regulator